MANDTRHDEEDDHYHHVLYDSNDDLASDERILTALCERLARHDYVDASEVGITVKNAKVTLSGRVVERYMQQAIEDLAEKTDGVRVVVNNIRVERPDERKKRHDVSPS
jgi:osmotically-inducible protein OsmY